MEYLVKVCRPDSDTPLVSFERRISAQDVTAAERYAQELVERLAKKNGPLVLHSVGRLTFDVPIAGVCRRGHEPGMCLAAYDGEIDGGLFNFGQPHVRSHKKKEA